MDTLLEWVKGQFQLLGFIIYIVYNEYKRWRASSLASMSQRDELIMFKAKAEEAVKNAAFRQANDEIDRYVFSQLKMYKTMIINKLSISDEILILAMDGVLLTALTKVKRNLMIHIEGNGYHELSNAELEEYIKYLSGEVIDTMLNTIEKNKNIDNVDKLIDEHEIVNMIRRIIDTSIGIHNRLLKKYIINYGG